MFSRRAQQADADRGHRLMDSAQELADSEEKPSEFSKVVRTGLFGQGWKDYPPEGHSYPKD